MFCIPVRVDISVFHLDIVPTIEYSRIHDNFPKKHCIGLYRGVDLIQFLLPTDFFQKLLIFHRKTKKVLSPANIS